MRDKPSNLQASCISSPLARDKSSISPIPSQVPPHLREGVLATIQQGINACSVHTNTAMIYAHAIPVGTISSAPHHDHLTCRAASPPHR